MLPWACINLQECTYINFNFFFPLFSTIHLVMVFYLFLLLVLTSILAKIYYAYYDRHREEREMQELLGQLDAAIHARDHALRKWPLMVKQVR